MRTWVFLLALLPTGLNAAQSTQQELLRVHITGIRSDKGRVMCALYASADGFAKDGNKALMQTSSPVADHQATCDFHDVHPGTYAVSVFHDENSNGRLDMNFMGIPREGVGTSNDAKGHFGPPKFEDAAFHYPGSLLELKIAMKYL